MRDAGGNGICGQIDQESIELHVMCRLSENSVREHLESCSFCRERVDECRSYIRLLKRALREFQRGEAIDSKQRGAESTSSPDE
jgi:hypothetical protein